MVIQSNKPKEEPIGQEEAKKQMLETLSKESSTVLTLAYIYAKGFENFGEDVTTRWKTAALQTDALNRAYIKGFEDAKEQMRKGEI